jgi:hypothetical protein
VGRTKGEVRCQGWGLERGITPHLDACCALMLSECRPKSSPSFLLATIAVAAGSRDPIEKGREEGHAQVGRTARHSTAFEQTL